MDRADEKARSVQAALAEKKGDDPGEGAPS